MCGNEWRAPFLSKEVGRDELKLRVFFGAEELTLPSTLSTSDLAVGARELCDPHTLPTLFRSLAAVTNVGRSAHIAALQQTSPTIREAAQLRQELAHLCFALFHLPVQVVQLVLNLLVASAKAADEVESAASAFSMEAACPRRSLACAA
eukprot:CAMPEP_0119390714 /NCGR_PEP_ID=MMETSP1334-20130426/114444_1 /TAXON_ID=127549 /ORGANISM="Calcidiscus leptoporus, Strain RCC1130" /LENGTH=148 /DNA_ID=CAMNT_0007413275 /DNA_START=477 /DNA_END=921 /DNA_ORIENTATION=+